MKILINSLPKSGTNFAEQVLIANGVDYGQFSLTAQGLEAPHRLAKILLRNRPFVEHNFVDIGIDFTRPFSHRYVSRALGQVHDNAFITAHANYSFQLDDLLERYGFKQIIMIRHPEEVLRSYIQYAQGYNGHLHHSSHVSHDVNQLAEAHVKGGKFGKHYLDPWAVRLDRIVQWKRFSRNCHFVKFEDVCATASEERQVGTVKHFTEVGLGLDQIVAGIQKSYGKSKTFRTATIRNTSFFNPSVRRLIAAASNDFCEAFSYGR